MFKNREDAGQLLASQLTKFKNSDAVILAVPRGGVPVAYMVSKALGLPLELTLVKKIGHPSSKEYAIGAASLTDYFVIPHQQVSENYIKEEVKKIRARLQEMQLKFMGNIQPAKLDNRIAIVVDDGIATGHTILAIVNLLKLNRVKKIIVAVPVCAKSAYEKIKKNVDEVIVLFVPEQFYGVGGFYEDFKQVSDQEVIEILNEYSVINQQK